MSERLGVEFDGEPVSERSLGEGGTPPWGLPAAIALVGALLLAVLVLVVAPAVGGHTASRASTAATTGADEERVADILESTRGALSAWGRFAASGDLGLLADHFVENGPQYRQLEAEAVGVGTALPRAEAYEVVMDGKVVAISTERAQVQARVLWQRAGEPGQHLDWMIDLRRQPSRGWAVWTIETVDA